MPTIPQFRGAPPERRSAGDIAAQREAVKVQIDEWLKKIASDPDRRAARTHGLVQINMRRAGQALPQFDVVGDGDVLVVSNLAAVPTDNVAVGRDALTSIDGRFAPQEVRIPGIDDVRVLVDTGGPNERTRMGLAASGLSAAEGSPVFMFPMGAVRKADGGPELSGPAAGQDWSRPERQPGPVPSPRVVVIDTGVSAEQRTDGWLSGLATTDNLDKLNGLPLDEYLDLGAGHGTFVTGIIQQIAPDTDIRVRQLLDSSGVGAETAIGQAIVEVPRDGAQIVNLSFGTVTPDDQPPQVLASALRAAIATSPDILFVCAAGNFADERPCWPGAFAGVAEFEDNVVSVAALALDADGQNAEGAKWSSRGEPWITCSTLGQGVVSTYVIGQEIPQPPPLRQDTFGNDSWAVWSGTSFAAPQIVGAIAWTMQQDGWAGSPLEAFREVMRDAPKIESFGSAIRILPV
jgi:hypothetical protein